MRANYSKLPQNITPVTPRSDCTFHICAEEVAAWARRPSQTPSVIQGSAKSSAQRVPGTLSPGIKLSERETSDSSPFSTVIKTAWSYSYTSTTPSFFMPWCSINFIWSEDCKSEFITETWVGLQGPVLRSIPLALYVYSRIEYQLH
jgi:hypothetical protein